MTKESIKDAITTTSKTEKFEHCVMCQEATNVLISTPIEFRDFYEIGCGQLCFDCAKKLWEASKKGTPLNSLDATLLFRKNNK